MNRLVPLRPQLTCARCRARIGNTPMCPHCRLAFPTRDRKAVQVVRDAAFAEVVYPPTETIRPPVAPPSLWRGLAVGLLLTATVAGAALIAWVTWVAIP